MKYKIHQIAPWNRQKLSHSLHLQASKIFVHELRGLIQARWTQCHTDIRLPLRGFHFFFIFTLVLVPQMPGAGHWGHPLRLLPSLPASWLQTRCHQFSGVTLQSEKNWTTFIHVTQEQLSAITFFKVKVYVQCLYHLP